MSKMWILPDDHQLSMVAELGDQMLMGAGASTNIRHIFVTLWITCT